MLLNQDEITQNNLIKNNTHKRREPASIPLTIHTIVTSDSEINSLTKDTKYSIPPQGMVLAISNEEITLTGKNILGFTTIKNYLSRRGIWALNIGIVDSNWSGPIASVLINFGKQPYELEIGEEFLRMTFQEYKDLSTESKNIVLDAQKKTNTVYELTNYIRERKGEFRLTMDEKFLMLGKLEETVSKSVKKQTLDEIGLVTRFLGFASIILTLTFFGFNYLTKDDEKKSNEYYENLLVKKSNEELNSKIDSLVIRINNLEKNDTTSH